MPHDKALGHAGTAQINIAVLEAQALGDLGLLVQREGRGLALVEDAQLQNPHLDLAGGQLGVDHPVGPGLDQTPDGQHPFASDAVRLGVDLGVDLGIKHHLGKAPAIPQVDKNTPAMVAAPQHPAHEDDLFADIGVGKGIAMVSAFKASHGFHRAAPLW